MPTAVISDLHLGALNGSDVLRPENEWPVSRGEADGPAGVLASWLPGSELTLAYPGLRLEGGVYATHGH